jgi:AraC-like DNA-binding protein
VPRHGSCLSGAEIPCSGPCLNARLTKSSRACPLRMGWLSKSGGRWQSALPEETHGLIRINSVARDLATSARTLQRRLADAGFSYQDLVELTRREAAEKYLADCSLTIAEVAYLLGYSEPSALHRAFKRWNHTTPQLFRQRQQAETLRLAKKISQ